MSSDWNDGMDVINEKPVSYDIPKIDLIAAMLIGINYGSNIDLSKRDAEYDFPATLERLILLAADHLEESGCCSDRPDTLEHDGKWFGIANVLSGRLSARSEKIATDITGYTNDGIKNSSALHSSILKIITPSRLAD